MTRTALASVACSIARTVDVLGDAWSWLIVRDLTAGLSRFEELQDDLSLSRKVLTQRLGELIEHGIVERTAYQQHPERYDYRLTPAGTELTPVLVAMATWGDRWHAPDGPPIRFRHTTCSPGAVTLACEDCGTPVGRDELSIEPGPGGRISLGTKRIGPRIAGRD